MQTINPSLVKRIYLNRSIALSSDVMFQAIEMGIPIILKQRNGRVAGRMWSAKYGSISTLRKKQLQLVQDSESTLLIKNILNQKLLNQQQLLLIFEPNAKDDKDYLQRSRGRIERYRSKLLSSSIEDLSSFKKSAMGFEGAAGRT